MKKKHTGRVLNNQQLKIPYLGEDQGVFKLSEVPTGHEEKALVGSNPI